MRVSSRHPQRARSVRAARSRASRSTTSRGSTRPTGAGHRGASALCAQRLQGDRQGHRRADKSRSSGAPGSASTNVDVPAASKRGHRGHEHATGNAVTTAEHAIGLLVLAGAHESGGLPHLKAGKWEKKKFEGRELANKTLGVSASATSGASSPTAPGPAHERHRLRPGAHRRSSHRAGHELVSLEPSGSVPTPSPSTPLTATPEN